MAQRIGIFGGTFDPIHVGHLVAAVEVRDALVLDRVLMVVAHDPWQKSPTRPVTAAEDRYAVVAAAPAGLDRIEPCRIELDRGGPSYTIDTVATLREEDSSAELFLVVGADVAMQLRTWRRVDELLDQVTLVVVDRGATQAVARGDVQAGITVAIPALEISSSDLRRRMAEGRSVAFLVPDAAIRCIHARALYAEQ
ncbi:MAG: nicotinate-nucleotide adenylyltransferase [Acidimicrobiales bacterium]